MTVWLHALGQNITAERAYDRVTSMANMEK